MDAARGADSVAGELLAFYREPARHRPPYLHGEVPMPDGQVVLRLALGRFPHGWLRDMPTRERDEVRVAAVAFVRQVCLWERATHYQVLCADPDAAREAIRENYQLLMALIHPDRQEAGSPWPMGCAQRANHAYETLGDAARRAEYDAVREHAGQDAAAEAAVRAAHVEPPHHHRERFSPALLLKRFALFAGVIAALFIVQAWWVGGESPQHSLLERAMPASGRWMRQVLPDPPRFLATSSPPVAAFDPGERMEPLKEPRRLASLGTWVPMPEPVREPAAAPVATAPLVPAPPAEAPATARPVAATLPRSSPEPAPATSAPIRIAQAAPPVRVAQGTPSAPNSTPTRNQVEEIVALLVGFYDAGDAERLMALFDAERLGWWAGYRLRGSYADFFAATKIRQLRMEQLSWQNNGVIAQARGEATVVAEFTDGRARIERRVPVEFDIGLKDGQARITRLSLFPGAQ